MFRSTDTAAVIGHPIAHSQSPRLFAAMAQAEKRPVAYAKLDVSPAELSQFCESLRDKRLFVGWNVTLPHKESILRFVDHCTDESRSIGAANVVHFSQGKSTAHNTDIVGIERTLATHRCRVKGQDVVLYGAGGAARAVAYVLGRAKARTVVVVNRSPARAESLCHSFGERFPATSFRVWRAADKNLLPICLINATSIGTGGVKGRFRFPSQTAPTALAFDLCYGSGTTPFLRQASARDIRVADGSDMLIWQAIGTWEIWFGPVKNRNRLRKRMKQEWVEK